MLFGWEISILIRLATTIIIIPLYVICFMWFLGFLENSSIVIATTIGNKIGVIVLERPA